jgi:hypothetical protein
MNKHMKTTAAILIASLPLGIVIANCSDSRAAGVNVEQVWQMPKELNEISANVLLSGTRMACIQDNAGVIFIYDMQSKTIESTIPFSTTGDYEGLAVVGDTYYVLRSDGMLYEIETRGKNEKPHVATYQLPLSASNDTEPMCHDRAHNRLLVGTKEGDLSGKGTNGVYSFDLGTKKMSTDELFTISGAGSEANDEHKKKSDNKKDAGKKKDNKTSPDIRPSEIAIHPKTGEVYILDGPKSELLIADPTGTRQISHTAGSQDVPATGRNVFFFDRRTVYLERRRKERKRRNCPRHIVTTPRGRASDAESRYRKASRQSAAQS